MTACDSILGNYLLSHMITILSRKPNKIVIYDMNSTSSDLPLFQFDLTTNPNHSKSFADELCTPEFHVYKTWHVVNVAYRMKNGVCESVNIIVHP